MHVVGFIIRIYHGARPPERHISLYLILSMNAKHRQPQLQFIVILCSVNFLCLFTKRDYGPVGPNVVAYWKQNKVGATFLSRD